MKQILKIMFFLYILSSCLNNKGEDFKDKNRIEQIKLNKTKSFEIDEFLENSAQYTILHYFDGGCAMCLGDFIFWLKEWQKINASEKIKYLFITSSTDEDIFTYYIDNSGIEHRENIYFVIDKENEFQINNPNIFPSTGYYLLNNNFEVLTNENPIKARNAKKVYKKLKLL